MWKVVNQYNSCKSNQSLDPIISNFTSKEDALIAINNQLSKAFKRDNLDDESLNITITDKQWIPHLSNSDAFTMLQKLKKKINRK